MNEQQNIENLKKLVSGENSDLLDKLKWEKENEHWLDRSFQIALKVVRAMRKQNLNQKDLAGQMHVTPQYISKMLKGKENLSLQTISKLEEVLKIKLISIPESHQDISFQEFDITQIFMMRELTESFANAQIQIFKTEVAHVEKNYDSIISGFFKYSIKKTDKPSSLAEEEEHELRSIA